AFACYTADLYLAFAILCRRAIAAAGLEAPADRQRGLRDLFHDAAQLSEIDDETERTLSAVLFDKRPEPDIDAEQAAVLIEIVKDVFHQHYVRTAKLKRAIKMRKFFAGETTQTVTPIASLQSRRNSA
ncbi:MAG: hypothetical protein R3305_04655, partial [Gammaproteobacteria bacterium]|nr:hypothetical protein [Gammaproteobacteria bacterium]